VEGWQNPEQSKNEKLEVGEAGLGYLEKTTGSSDVASDTSGEPMVGADQTYG
jgi:hypothetical protein